MIKGCRFSVKSKPVPQDRAFMMINLGATICLRLQNNQKPSPNLVEECDLDQVPQDQMASKRPDDIKRVPDIIIHFTFFFHLLHPYLPHLYLPIYPFNLPIPLQLLTLSLTLLPIHLPHKSLPGQGDMSDTPR